MTGTKWSGAYFADLAERVGSTLIYSVITFLTTMQLTDLDGDVAWTIIGLPTVLSLLKGLLANMANGESGASALSSPPVTVDEDPQRDEVGAVNWMAVVAVALVALVIVVLFGLAGDFDLGNGRG